MSRKNLRKRHKGPACDLDHELAVALSLAGRGFDGLEGQERRLRAAANNRRNTTLSKTYTQSEKMVIGWLRTLVRQLVTMETPAEAGTRKKRTMCPQMFVRHIKKLLRRWQKAGLCTLHRNKNMLSVKFVCAKAVHECLETTQDELTRYSWVSRAARAHTTHAHTHKHTHTQTHTRARTCAGQWTQVDACASPGRRSSPPMNLP
jgi:hypothetical protein